MKVWIVSAGMQYDGTFATVVCSTQQKAEKLREEWEGAGGFDWYSSDEYEVDGHEPDYSHFT